MQLMLKVFQPSGGLYIYFPYSTVEDPVEPHLSGEEKLLYQLTLDCIEIGSLHSELWDLESVSSLLDFLSSSSSTPSYCDYSFFQTIILKGELQKSII